MAKPEIRLKGFEGEWNHSCFKDLYYSNSIKNNLLFDTDKIISVANMYFNPGNTISDKNYLRTYNIFKLGDIAFEGNRSKNYAHGRFVENTIGDGIVSHVFKVFSPKSDKFDLKYWKYAINNERVMGKILVRCTKASTMMNDLVEKDFLREFVNHPSLNEQIEIGNFMESLDSMIQGVTKKIASLKQMKQACLVSMFPQEGETIPRVRFKGFKGEWLNVELSECLSVCKDRNLSETYGKGDVLSVSDDYGVVNQIELLGRSYAGKSVANYRILRNGHIVYTKSPLKVKPFGIIKVNNGSDGIVSTLYAVYVPMDWVSAKFINYYFEPSFRMNKYIHPLVNKGAKNDMKVSDENVLKGNIFIPKEKEEQEKIATYFTSLDKQISLQEARLEKLKQIKSACLDKMFV